MGRPKFPQCGCVLWCQIIRSLVRQCIDSAVKLCSRSARTLGVQALGTRKGLFLNGRRGGDMEDALQTYIPAASLSSHHAVGLGLSGETDTPTNMLTAGLYIVVVIRGGSLSLSTPC